MLIPREFSLVLKPFASPPSPELTPRKRPGSAASAAGRERLEAGRDRDTRRSPAGSWENRRELQNDLISKTQSHLSPKNGHSISSNGLKSEFSAAKKDSIGSRRGSLETPSPDPEQSGEEGDIDVTGEGERTPSPSPPARLQPLRPIPVYRPLEMGATLWANMPLYPGQTFYADQGEIRLDHLEIYNILPRFDVSTLFDFF